MAGYDANTSKHGAGLPMYSVPKAISSQPPLRPVFRPKALPEQVGLVWHGGPRPQATWVMDHTNAFDRMAFLANTDARPKTAPSQIGRPKVGVPPPIPAVLRSQNLLAQWNSRWDVDVVSAKDLRPEMNTGMVCGRPVQVIICSHPHAPPLEWDPYQTFAFWPLRPVVLCGPSSGKPEAATMVHKFSVIQWWKVTSLLFGSL